MTWLLILKQPIFLLSERCFVKITSYNFKRDKILNLRWNIEWFRNLYSEYKLDYILGLSIQKYVFNIYYILNFNQIIL